jgi:hypothetical protein
MASPGKHPLEVGGGRPKWPNCPQRPHQKIAEVGNALASQVRPEFVSLGVRTLFQSARYAPASRALRGNLPWLSRGILLLPGPIHGQIERILEGC